VDKKGGRYIGRNALRDVVKLKSSLCLSKYHILGDGGIAPSILKALLEKNDGIVIISHDFLLLTVTITKQATSQCFTMRRY
jgi:hypothetical protein